MQKINRKVLRNQPRGQFKHQSQKRRKIHRGKLQKSVAESAQSVAKKTEKNDRGALHMLEGWTAARSRTASCLRCPLKGAIASGTAAFVQDRERLPRNLLRALVQDRVRCVTARALSQDRFRGVRLSPSSRSLSLRLVTLSAIPPPTPALPLRAPMYYVLMCPASRKCIAKRYLAIRVADTLCAAIPLRQEEQRLEMSPAIVSPPYVQETDRFKKRACCGRWAV